MQLTGQRHVIGEFAQATHQGGVFDAANRLAAAESAHVTDGFQGRGHACAPAIAAPACFTAATMLT